MSIQRIPKSGKPKPGHRVRWRVRWEDALGKERSKYLYSEKEAKAYDAHRKEKSRLGTFIDPSKSKTTIRQAYQTWMNRPLKERTKKSYADTEKALGDFGETPLGALTRLAAEEWHTELRKTLAPSTAREHMVRLSSAMNLAVEDGLLVRNPVRVPKAESGGVTRSEIPTVEEVRRIVRELRVGGGKYRQKRRSGPKRDGDGWVSTEVVAGPQKAAADMVLTAVGSGLRVSEIGGLTVRDVDLKQRVIRVEKQISADGKKRVSTKTAKAVRTVPIQDDLVAVLRPYVEDREAGDYVFVTVRGTPFTAKAAGDALRRTTACQELGWTFHSFRHLYASLLIARNVPVNGVQRLMGHTSAATTLEVYTHLFPDNVDQVRAALDGVVDSVGQ